MNENDSILKEQLVSLFEANTPQIDDRLPSEWAEQHVSMEEPFPGPFRYSRTPYTREIIDCLHPSVVVQTIVVKKGAQVGFSSGVIYPGIGWIIQCNPGNTLLSVGAPNLIGKAMEKMDMLINAAGLRDYIQPQAPRKRNNKTGDTNEQKEFAKGYLLVASANNHKNIRQIDLKYQFLDDYVAIKKASKESGSTGKKLESRSAAYAETKKEFKISTPELSGSNIDEAYDLGDKRRYFIPCPNCHGMITLEWSVKSEKTPDKTCGIYWELNENKTLNEDSVGYVCQKCDEFFDERNKMDWLNNGKWEPTTTAKKPRYRSYHISALYAPIGMYGWKKYVSDFIEAHPDGLPRKEDLFQVFQNECLGLSYEPPTDTPKATDLMKRCRDYPIGTIPEAVSEADGNGEIILLTLAADCNGTLNDARIDYEVKAWSRNGATYSVQWGSLGTFIPRQSADQKARDTREKYTYEMNRSNSVWRLMDDVLGKAWPTDTGRKMKVFISAIDAGYLDAHVFNYIDRSQFGIIGVMGDKENAMVRVQENLPVFKQATSRHNLFMLNVNMLKDDMANRMRLPWDRKNDQSQPHEFMNFPQYSYDGFFAHYESETRKENEKGYFGWQKKSPVHDNHAWDTGLYNYAVVQIFLWRLFKKGNKEEVFNWEHYASQCPVRGK